MDFKYTGRIQSLLPVAHSYDTNDQINHDDVLKGTGRSGTPISKLYFSRVNVSALQQGIRYSVHKYSNEKYLIDNQSEKELMLIMRSIYLTYSNELPFDVISQVKELNKKVIGYCVPRIIQELDMNSTYKHDITHMPDPISRSTNVSVKGSRSLERTEF